MENKCSVGHCCPQDEDKAGWFHHDVIELKKLDNDMVIWMCPHCGYTYIDKARNWVSYEK